MACSHLSIKKDEQVKEATTSLLSSLKVFVKTINFDNGKELVLHKEIFKEIECNAYFANPYRSSRSGAK